MPERQHPTQGELLGMRMKSRADCSKLTPRFTTTASDMHSLHSNSAFAATYRLDYSTPISGRSPV